MRREILGPVWMVVLAVLAASGCATKGFVRSQTADLRGEMGQMEARLKTQDQQNIEATAFALGRADSAFVKAGLAWSAALGHVGLREVDRSRIYFSFDSADLSADARATLDPVRSRVETSPNYAVQVFGFADPTGPEEYNYRLASRRADAVLRCLIGTRLAQLSRCQSLSFGEEVPPSEASSLGENKLRRSVLVILLERVPLEERPPGIASR